MIKLISLLVILVLGLSTTANAHVRNCKGKIDRGPRANADLLNNRNYSLYLSLENGVVECRIFPNFSWYRVYFLQTNNGWHKVKIGDGTYIVPQYYPDGSPTLREYTQGAPRPDIQGGG